MEDGIEMVTNMREREESGSAVDRSQDDVVSVVVVVGGHAA